MSIEKETTLNESHRLEVEITTVLLGFVFVTYSIVLTAQSDVLSLMNQVGFRLLIGNSIIWLRAVDVLSESGLYCSFSLLGAILFYLLFLRFKKEAMLLTARSLLTIGLFLSIVLLLLINTLYSIRLVGATQFNVVISPFGSLVLNLSGIVAAIYILVVWVMWFHKNIRVRLKKAKPLIHNTVITTEGKLEVQKMSENRRIRRNKDSDLLKIQILADYYQASFSFLGSIVSGAFIGLYVVAITLRLENVLGDISYYVFLGIILSFLAFYALRTYRSYHSDLEKIDNLFIRVQNGETLPSITELRKMKKE